MKKLFFAIVAIGFCMPTFSACADTLELRNGSVIKGTFIGGSEAQISFRVGSSLQRYPVADVVSVRFDSDSASSGNYGNSGNYGQQPQSNYPPQPQQDYSPAPPQNNSPSNYNPAPPPSNSAPGPPPNYSSAPPPDNSDNSAAVDSGVTLPTGTHLSIRTVDAIDSNRNHVGDQFTSTLDQALYVNDVLVAPRGAYVYGRLEEIKESGQLSGRAQLRLSLTGISLRGQTYPLITGDYQLAGKSRSTGTAAKVGGGAVVGALIGAAVGGGKGAAIGAGVGAGAGTAAQIATKGDQIHIPSETILDFTLDQPVTLPVAQNN
ncbi:MAG TPA: hypothetical protein VGK22_08040 [Candidatus Angelobacter sp.]